MTHARIDDKIGDRSHCAACEALRRDKRLVESPNSGADQRLPFNPVWNFDAACVGSRGISKIQSFASIGNAPIECRLLADSSVIQWRQ